jgi:DNA-binding NtrC family response regulator
MYILCMKMAMLSSEERDLCNLVAQASVANHFDEERDRLDRLIAGADDTIPRSEVFAKVLQRISSLVATQENEGRANFLLYPEADQAIVRFTLLFDVFHRYLKAFDDHILEQIAAGDEPLPVSFCENALALLGVRGFAKAEAVEWFAVFFQLRRAYFFIERKLVGCSPAMRELRKNLWNNVFTADQEFYRHRLLDRMEDFSTLLLGETGTGKGSAALSIGCSGYIPFDPKQQRFSVSFTRAFVAINLSQFSASLIESELFGHRKGAFTGAIEAHEGIFSRSSPHGAIFLDEIGEVAPAIQIKLLQLLQERTFSPVGVHEKRRFAGRVIAATNRDLDRLRREERFRDDFYYRLCSDIVTVPTLRRRISEDPAELDMLIRHVTASIVGADAPELTALVQKLISGRLRPDYPWPGNVRELEQCVRRIILRHEYTGDSLLPKDPTAALTDEIAAGALDADSLLSRYCRMLYHRFGTYEAVAKITALDRRTVKKFIGG